MPPTLEAEVDVEHHGAEHQQPRDRRKRRRILAHDGEEDAEEEGEQADQHLPLDRLRCLLRHHMLAFAENGLTVLALPPLLLDGLGDRMGRASYGMWEGIRRTVPYGGIDENPTADDGYVQDASAYALGNTSVLPNGSFAASAAASTRSRWSRSIGAWRRYWHKLGGPRRLGQPGRLAFSCVLFLRRAILTRPDIATSSHNPFAVAAINQAVKWRPMYQTPNYREHRHEP